MRKILVLLLFYLLTPRDILAAEGFTIGSETTYEILEDGNTKVLHEITIENNVTETYATNYVFTLRGSGAKNFRVFDSESELKFSEHRDGQIIRIEIVFENPVVGARNARKFSISYDDPSVLTKIGEVTEIVIPKIANDQFDSYKLKVKIPKLEEASYISPEPDTVLLTSGAKTYYFSGPAIVNSGVNMAFGQFQVFSFDIAYHLQNPLAVPSKMEIAIIPDTSYQKVFYDALSPRPDNVYEDKDGNWIAVYTLSARERVDVKALGSVQVFANPWKIRPVSEDVLSLNLSEGMFWQVSDPKILDISKNLKNPKEVYDYVVKTLRYDYEKVSENRKRTGAVAALNSPENSICTEFTDVFVTLARAMGTPAREVNGYAYTDNETLKPISLVADVLHAWPEYWDNEHKVWVPADPTWGSTTGGVDYFSKFDMKRIAFVMRGSSKTTPIPPGSYKLGANPQKDVYVSFSKIPEKKNENIEVSFSQRTTLPYGVKLLAKVYNPGPVALYDQKIELLFDDEKKYERMVGLLLPYETRYLEFEIPYRFLTAKMPEKATLIAGGRVFTYEVSKTHAIARDIISIFFVLLLISGLSFLILKRKK